jgi:cell division protein FtsW
MARRLKSDAVLFTTTLVLLVIGVAWVYSASVVRDPGIVIKQGLFLVLGMAGLFAAMNLDYRRLGNRPALLLTIGAVVVLLAAVLLLGHQVKGARRWLTVLDVRFQPSELAKMVAIVFAAATLGRRLEEGRPLEPAFFQTGVVVALFAGLIFMEPDYGGGLVLLAVAFVMMFVSGLPYRYVAAAALALPPPLLAMLLFSAHSRERLQTWLDPWAEPMGRGFQPIQSYIALGTGGIWGRGFLAGVQKMYYLPEAHNDYIFAVIGEEQGLIGAPDSFGSLLALGITALFGIQALVNMGVVTGLLPAKGLSLPLVSAGGSSLIVSLVAMGMLLNISQQASATALE